MLRGVTTSCMSSSEWKEERGLSGAWGDWDRSSSGGSSSRSLSERSSDIRSGDSRVLSGRGRPRIRFLSRGGGEEEAERRPSRFTSLPFALAEIKANIGERGGLCRFPRGERWRSDPSAGGGEGESLRKLGIFTIPLRAELYFGSKFDIVIQFLASGGRALVGMIRGRWMGGREIGTCPSSEWSGVSGGVSD